MLRMQKHPTILLMAPIYIMLTLVILPELVPISLILVISRMNLIIIILLERIILLAEMEMMRLLSPKFMNGKRYRLHIYRG